MLDNNYWKIPEHTYQAIRRYIENRLAPGDFLYAVLTNDLVGTCGLADSQNQAKLCNILGFIHNEIPIVAWGNPERVEKWLQGKSDNKLLHSPQL